MAGKRTFLTARLAGLRRLQRAIFGTVTSLVAGIALAGELTLNARVGTVSLVVAHFTTVEALAHRLLLWAICPGISANLACH